MKILCIGWDRFIDIGMWLTFAGAFIVAMIEARKMGRLTFINTIMEARKEYLKDLDTVQNFV